MEYSTINHFFLSKTFLQNKVKEEYQGACTFQYQPAFNPSNADATSVQSTRMQNHLKTI